MTREEAINLLMSANVWTDEERTAWETLVPELAESEDERIREGLVKLLTVAGEAYVVNSTGIKKDSYLAYLEKQKEQSITANDLDEEIKRFFDDCIDVHEAKLYGNISERVIPVGCYELTARHFAKWSEKQKEQKSWKVGENAYFDPNTDMWFIKKEQKPTEDKELLKNILFQKKGITYDDYKCKNNPYVGLYFDELIKCLEEYDKARSNR